MGRFPRVTHPSATPYCYGVRLACIRPAASVRSEPGSNSQIESLDSGRLGGNHSKDLCVTGTFTHEMHPEPGCPGTKRIAGDGLKRRSRQSLVRSNGACAPKDPPGHRRLRFPSFQFNCQRTPHLVDANSPPSQFPSLPAPKRNSIRTTLRASRRLERLLSFDVAEALAQRLAQVIN